jgi:hypothetical protein
LASGDRQATCKGSRHSRTGRDVQSVPWTSRSKRDVILLLQIESDSLLLRWLFTRFEQEYFVRQSVSLNLITPADRQTDLTAKPPRQFANCFNKGGNLGNIQPGLSPALSALSCLSCEIPGVSYVSALLRFYAALCDPRKVETGGTKKANGCAVSFLFLE